MREKIAKTGEEQQIEELAKQLEEPRALRLLAEWIAIDNHETRLEAEKYQEDALELYDYLLAIGFRLIPVVCEEIEKVENPYTKEAGGDEHETGFESCRQKILSLLKK